MSVAGRTVDRARGRWLQILPALGIEARYLRNKHGPCPLCGGRDRYRFDDRDGSGSYYCNRCGPGSGIVLLRKLHGWDYATACREVDQIIGTDLPAAPSANGRGDDRAGRLERIKRVIAEANDREVVEQELSRRGLRCWPTVLVGHPALPYHDGGRCLGRYPAVIGPILGPDGQLQSCQRIYVGDLTPRKKAMPAVDTISGGAVRLFQPTHELGIAEGVETAIAAYELFRVPTWAALSTAGLKSFATPSGVHRLTVFADNDCNFAGQAAAYNLAERVARDLDDVEVKVPGTPGADWLDVLNA